MAPRANEEDGRRFDDGHHHPHRLGADVFRHGRERFLLDDEGRYLDARAVTAAGVVTSPSSVAC